MLICTFEKFDDFPIFVIETRTGKSTNFGQLPLEILWVIKFLLDRAAIISVFFMFDNYRKSPLVQGEM